MIGLHVECARHLTEVTLDSEIIGEVDTTLIKQGMMIGVEPTRLSY